MIFNDGRKILVPSKSVFLKAIKKQNKDVKIDTILSPIRIECSYPEIVQNQHGLSSSWIGSIKQKRMQEQKRAELINEVVSPTLRFQKLKANMQSMKNI